MSDLISTQNRYTRSQNPNPNVLYMLKFVKYNFSYRHIYIYNLDIKYVKL